MAPKQSRDIELANLRPQAFEGLLRLVAKEGFQVTPRETRVTLANGQRETVVRAGSPLPCQGTRRNQIRRTNRRPRRCQETASA